MSYNQAPQTPTAPESVPNFVVHKYLEKVPPVDIQAAVRDILSKAGVPHVFTRLDYELVLGTHGEEEDADVLDPFFPADIFFPEQPGDQREYDVFQSIADGFRTMKHVAFEEIFPGAFTFAVFQKLGGSGAGIGNVDSAPESEEYTTLATAIREGKKFIDDRAKSTTALPEVAKQYWNVHKRVAAAQLVREKTMITRIAPEIARLIQRKPKLQKAHRIQIVQSLGLSHILFSRAIAGVHIRQHLPPKIHFKFDDELMRKAAYHEVGAYTEEEIDPYLLATRAIIERCVKDLINPLIAFDARDAGDEIKWFIHYVAGQASQEDLEKIYAMRSLPYSRRANEFAAFLKERKLPSSTKEIVLFFKVSHHKPTD